MLKVILLSVVIIAVAFSAIAVKLLFKKDGKFSGTCSGKSELLREKGVVCSVCGAQPEEECKK